MTHKLLVHVGAPKTGTSFVQDLLFHNPQALAEVRAPLFEEKVVDHVLAQVKVAEEPVSKEQLFSDEDDAADAKGKAETTA